MAKDEKVIMSASTLTAIADAIRHASGDQSVMYPSEMPERIRSLCPAAVEFGEYVPASDVATFKMPHNLGSIPYMVFIWKKDEALCEGSVRISVAINGGVQYSDEAGREIASYTVTRGVQDTADRYATHLNTRAAGDDGYGDTSTHFFAPTGTSVYYRGGEAYCWMAVGR